MIAPSKTILFVYGTLKRGFANHHLMAGQDFIGEGVTLPHYRVLDLGPHPGLIADEANGLAVKGELWAVSDECLARLDEFEEVPGPFIRRRLRSKAGEKRWMRTSGIGPRLRERRVGTSGRGFASRERKRPEETSGRLRSRLTQSPIAENHNPSTSSIV